jgi:hypothetical protein
MAEGDAAAAERFWREVAVQGTPLIEPIEEDRENFLVTFLFRHGAEVRNVVVFPDSGLWGDIPSNRMERLGGTDIWSRTFLFRRDARFTYLLSVNDSLTPVKGVIDVEAWIKRTAAWRFDPLNPRRFPSCPKPLSVVDLPSAPPQPYVSLRPNAPKGKVEAHRIKSAVLGSERSVWIYALPGYENESLPGGLLVLFDGAAYIPWVPTPTILDNLLAEHRISRLLAVFVGHPPGSRDSDLTRGLMEDQPAIDGTPSIVAVNRHLRDVLRAKGYQLNYRDYNGGHEGLNWRGFLADGLIALLGGRPGR